MSIIQSFITAPTRWDIPARYTYRRHEEGCRQLAIVFPGQAYPVDAPLLWYAAEAALSAGFDVLGLEYGFQAKRTGLRIDDVGNLVTEVQDGLAAFLSTHDYQQILIIAKSLGTVVASGILKFLSLKNADSIYLTPLPSTISVIQQASRMLVVVGDADPLFSQADVAQILERPAVKVTVIPGADHALQIPRHVVQSLNILQQVVDECARFISP